MASKVVYPWLRATVSIPLSIQNGKVAPSNGQLDPVPIAVASSSIRVFPEGKFGYPWVSQYPKTIADAVGEHPRYHWYSIKNERV
jgi:hypothetical protein